MASDDGIILEQSDKCRIAELTRQVERLRGMLKRSYSEKYSGCENFFWTDAEIDAELRQTGD